MLSRHLRIFLTFKLNVYTHVGIAWAMLIYTELVS